MSKEEIDAVRRRSKAVSSGPWVTDYFEMAKKTAFRRVSKWIPLSAEIVEAFERDDDRLDDRAHVIDAPRTNGMAGLRDQLSSLSDGVDPAPDDDASQGESPDDGAQPENPAAMSAEELRDLEREAGGGGLFDASPHYE